MATPSYQDFVSHRTRLNPCLSGLATYLSSKPRNASTTIVIDYPHDGGPPSSPISIAEPSYANLIDGISSATRFIFVEDIGPRLINLLGALLDVDPLFFANHFSTDLRNVELATPPPSAVLPPSVVSERGYLHLHYQQVVSLGPAEALKDAAYSLKSDSNIPRNIRRLPPLSGRQLALARACCSVLVKKIANGSSIGLCLIDPPVRAAIDAPKQGPRKAYPAKHVQGGLEDFGPPSSYSSYINGKDNDLWDNSSMLSSLLHYYRTPPPGFSRQNPTILDVGYYPVRLVLSEWSVYTILISRYFKYYEYSLNDMAHRLHDDDIIDLQRWRRRSKQSQQKLSVLAAFISYWMPQQQHQPWAVVLDDVHHVRQQLKYYSQSLEQIVMVATSMVQLFDSRRSILEAVNVRRLTYIALVFVPLSWVASLFSMSEGYVPGNRNFWVYFATALPLVVVVLLVSAIPYDRVKECLARRWTQFVDAKQGTRRFGDKLTLP
ncbi:hypothetical protein EDB81DRAFT_880418 [Dactylonectria macrodidyma]|uniref:Tyrosinase copper-binding domain-containing protein n=1 Tax=Dactylonectria macrodidyma TaxID=307937 RepID=A0A9P9F7E6_9HYPO|nr:hypothetical protein EDB81DRAFT_880418 [Dactylonectria macrodidyma]